MDEGGLSDSVVPLALTVIHGVNGLHSIAAAGSLGVAMMVHIGLQSAVFVVFCPVLRVCVLWEMRLWRAQVKRDRTW